MLRIIAIASVAMILGACAHHHDGPRPHGYYARGGYSHSYAPSFRRR